MQLLGLDIGGTKTSVCVGTATGRILGAQRMPTLVERGPADWFRRARALADEVLRETGVPRARIKAVGISCPGPLSVRRGLMLEPPNMKGWTAVPVVRWARQAFRRPVYIDNDANACAQAEWLFGSHRGARNLVYLTMSSGIGAGVIVNGRIAQGASDTFGEIGHHVVDLHGPPCPCGLRGCLEAFCGGVNLANRLRREIVGKKIRTAILAEAGGDPARIDFKAFVGAVKRRDPYALQEWRRYIERLAQGIGNVIQFYNPEVLLLGTIAIHAGPTLLVPLRKAVKGFAWPMGADACEIRASALGTKIGDLSALAVALCALTRRPDARTQ